MVVDGLTFSIVCALVCPCVSVADRGNMGQPCKNQPQCFCCCVLIPNRGMDDGWNYGQPCFCFECGPPSLCHTTSMIEDNLLGMCLRSVVEVVGALRDEVQTTHIRSAPRRETQNILEHLSA